jgi:hypothetical protein
MSKRKTDKREWQNKQGVCHTVALPFNIKILCEGKRIIMETKILHHAKI